MLPSSFKPYYLLTPASLLILRPWVLAGAGPSVTSARAQPWLVLSLQVPQQTSTPGAISSRLTMWSLKSFLCISMGVTCVYVLMLTTLREKAEEIQGKMLCRGHFLIRLNLQEHAWDRLESTLLWLFFIVLMYVTVKLAGQSGESNVQTPPSHQGNSFGSPGKKKKKASPKQRLYVRYLNPAWEGPCKLCVQGAESETRCCNHC